MEQFRNFKIVENLGASGLGNIYIGYDPQTEQVVAIKILRAQYAKSTAFVDRFQSEAEVLSKLDHPGIVKVIDSGVEGDDYFIVMEWVKGKTLQELRDEGRKFTVPEITEILKQGASILDFVHSNGVIHRDLKPSNIMLLEGPRIRVKILNFGMAAEVDGSEGYQTRLGMHVAQADYSSPEQIFGKKVDSRSDIYSLGITGYELLTGKLPAVKFSDGSRKTRPGEIASNIPEALDRAIMKAANDLIGYRYQRAGEFAQDMSDILAHMDFVAAPSPDRGQPAPEKGASSSASAYAASSGSASVATPAPASVAASLSGSKAGSAPGSTVGSTPASMTDGQYPAAGEGGQGSELADDEGEEGSAAGDIDFDIDYGAVSESSEITMIDNLVDTLEAGDDHESDKAAMSLSRIDNTRVIERLARLIETGDWKARKKAADALARMGDQAVPHLVSLAGLQDLEAVHWAIDALGTCGAESAFPALQNLLKDQRVEVSYMALEAFSGLRADRAIKSLVEVFDEPFFPLARAASSVAVGFGAEAVPALMRSLAAGSPGRRYWAAATLARIHLDDDGRRLAELFPGLSEEGRVNVIVSLERERGAGVDRFLLSCFTDPSQRVKEHALRAVVMRGQRMAGLLRDLAELPDPGVRLWALKATFEIFREKSVPVLKKFSVDSDVETRIFVARSLARVSGKESLALLASMVADPSVSVREEALHSLRSFGKESIKYLAGLIEKGSDGMEWALRGVAESGEPGREIIAKVLKGGRKKEKLMAISALEGTGRPQLLRLLVDALGDPSPVVRLAAGRAIGTSGDDAAEPLGQALLENPDLADKARPIVSRFEEAIVANLTGAALAKAPLLGRVAGLYCRLDGPIPRKDLFRLLCETDPRGRDAVIGGILASGNSRIVISMIEMVGGRDADLMVKLANALKTMSSRTVDRRG